MWLIPDDVSPRRPIEGLVGTPRPSLRYRAACVDGFLSAYCFFGTTSWVRDYLPKASSTQTHVFVAVIVTALYFLYYWVSEAFFSTTPGKAWFGLCIRHIDGSKCSKWGAFLRTLTRVIEINPLLGALPAILLIFFTQRKQRLGDLLAGTVVVEKQSVT